MRPWIPPQKKSWPSPVLPPLNATFLQHLVENPPTMTVLGKRKAPEPPVSREDANEIFRRHFESRFAPIEVEKRPVADDDDEDEVDDGDDDSDDEAGPRRPRRSAGSDDDEAEWGGLSDDEDSDDEDGTVTGFALWEHGLTAAQTSRLWR